MKAAEVSCRVLVKHKHKDDKLNLSGLRLTPRVTKPLEADGFAVMLSWVCRLIAAFLTTPYVVDPPSTADRLWSVV